MSQFENITEERLAVLANFRIQSNTTSRARKLEWAIMLPIADEVDPALAETIRDACYDVAVAMMSTALAAAAKVNPSSVSFKADGVVKKLVPSEALRAEVMEMLRKKGIIP